MDINLIQRGPERYPFQAKRKALRGKKYVCVKGGGGGGGETVNIQLNGSQERDRRNIQNMSPKRAAAQPLQNNLVNMKIFILLKNIRLIIISKTPDPFNLKLGQQEITLNTP